MKRYISIVWLCLAAGCAQPQAVTPEAAGPIPRFAPRPYSASQIREAHPDGTTLSFLLQQTGSGDVVQVMQFSEADESGTTVATSTQSPEGDVLGQASSARTTWHQLRDHASFEVGRTSIGPSRCRVVAGSYDCMLYEVNGDDGIVQEFYFADALPGPPVLLLVRKGDQQMLRMELIEYQRGPK